MLIKYYYSQDELDSAVKYLSNHNYAFLGQEDFIRQTILEYMEKLVKGFPDISHISTMGFLLLGDVLEEESLDHGDQNIVNINILVSPSFSKDMYYDDDMQEKQIIINE